MRKHSLFVYDWRRKSGTYQMFQFSGKVKDLRNAFKSILSK